MPLSKRLQTCLQYTKGFQELADIGTDHALLPIAAIKQDFVQHALAIDNKKGPYDIAKENISKYQLDTKIDVLLQDGLSGISSQTDVVVISGMGGFLIRNILIQDSLQNVRRLILQPNSDVSEIRLILPEIGFYVFDELVISDQGKYYDILVLERGRKSYSNQEITFGPINLVKKSEHFVNRLNKELEIMKQNALKITNPTQLQELDYKIKQYQEVLR